VLLLLAATATVAAGCSGRDAREAQDLLTQSQAAFANVRSATFTAQLSVTGGPEALELQMAGGGYEKGKHAGDFYVLVTASNLPFHEVVVVQRSGHASMRVDGASLGEFPLPPRQDDPVDLVDFAQYVKDVRVEKGKLIDGETMTKLTGVIDTKGLVEGSLGSLGGIATAGGSGFDFSDAFGDTRVVLYLSETTQLPMRGLVDIPMKVAGEKILLRMDFAYTSFNEKVEFPRS
jgi:hypothetical protein